MDSAVPVVYIPLHEGTAPFIDMPLDFILPVFVRTTGQSPPAASQMLGNQIQMSNV